MIIYIFIIINIIILLIIIYFNFIHNKLIFQPYSLKIKSIISQFHSFDNKPIVKNEGHIFGLPIHYNVNKLNLQDFNNIIHIDYVKQYIEVEGSTYISTILNELVNYNWIIQIPPDMNHLTISGLISGIGSGSSSFKYGFIHENILEMDVLTGVGEIVTCSKTQNSDLFYAIPNSFGTLGYILKVKVKIRKATTYVRVNYIHFDESEKYFKKLYEYSTDPNIDFLEGTIFSSTHFVLIIGYLQYNLPPNVNLFNHTNIFWKNLKDKNLTLQFFTLNDYIWRWDPDMYYTTMESPHWTRNSFMRNLLPKCFLTSTCYRNIIDINSTHLHCNNILIPIEKSNEFFLWFSENYPLYPIYICPIKSNKKFTLWKEGDFCNFGIGYGVNFDKNEKSENLDLVLEEKILEFNGNKLLYTSYFSSEEQFWNTINTNSEIYYNLKKKYDPYSKFLSLYDKIKTNKHK